jgi:signal transduction histidine kinase
VALRVEDDGRGFELEALRNSKDGYKHHLGLVSIQERVEMLDGSVKIYSSPGHGTSMQARIPVEWEAVT